jgi:hypothetical protein
LKEFLTEEGLPFVLVCVAVAGLTVALFGFPRTAPDPVPSPAQRPPQASARMDEALTRAIAALRAGRPQADSAIPGQPAPPATAVPRGSAAARAVAAAGAMAAAPAAPGGLPESNAPMPNASLMSAVTSLADVVKTVRAVRTEDDVVRAKQQMRAVRAQMQAACTSGVNSAFCDSAREMSSMGF